MYQATKYLINLNHKKIAFIACHYGEFSDVAFSGVKQVLSEAELSFDPNFLKFSRALFGEIRSFSPENQ